VASDDLAAIVDELYGLGLEEFIAARNARAKQLGKGEAAAVVKALPKPVTAAWLVNQVVRAHRADVEQFLALGAAFRTAQSDGAADELRALNRQRQQSLAALGKLMPRHSAGDDVARAVEDTWRAALMDEAAGRAVLSGRLVKPLAAAGFGTVELAGVLAAPDLPTPELPGPAATPIRSRGRKSAPAREPRADTVPTRAQAAAARAAARRVAEQVAAAERKAAAARKLRDRLAAEVERLGTTLARAQEELARAEEDLAAADDAVVVARE
jgi:hypothetical protein